MSTSLKLLKLQYKHCNIRHGAILRHKHLIEENIQIFYLLLQNMIPRHMDPNPCQESERTKL